jgi:hypothetical protein
MFPWVLWVDVSLGSVGRCFLGFWVNGSGVAGLWHVLPIVGSVFLLSTSLAFPELRGGRGNPGLYRLGR